MEATLIRPWRTLAAALLIGVSLASPAGCSLGRGPLEGTHWKLTDWTLSSLNPADFAISAQFADGRVSGASGVNTYSGPYRRGPNGAFSAGPLSGTLMGGSEPAMRAETAYLTLLGQAKSFKSVDGKLTLYDKYGNESLVFEAAGE